MKVKHTLTLFLAVLMCMATPAVLAEEAVEVQETSAKDVTTMIDMEAIAAELNVELAVLEKAAEINPRLFLSAAYAGDMYAISMLVEQAAEVEEAETAVLPSPNILRFCRLVNGMR